MPVPQIIIAWDQFGIKVEAPGPNGTRIKIEDVSFDQLPSSIQAALIEQKDRLDREPKPILAPSARDRIDPEVERRERIEREKVARQERFAAWLDTLTDAERERQIAIRDAKLQKARDAENERAKSIWYNTASRHGKQLADRVISDPKRRPRIARATNQNTKSKSGFVPLKLKIEI